MTDLETHPAGTAARIAELESANGVHILRALSKQEMVEVEKMAADGKFQEAAQKFGGQVTYHQDQCDLPPMADAELALHLRGGLVPMSVAYRAASRIEQLVATVEQLEASLTRANAATAAAYEVAAKVCSSIIKDYDCLKADGKTYYPMWVQKVAKGMVSIARQDIRAIAAPDQTAALDRLIAEAEARVWEKAAEICPEVEPSDYDEHCLVGRFNQGFDAGIDYCRSRILAASKKGGV